MRTASYLTVRNFDRFQHYKSRKDMQRPAWIKLYALLLRDYDFQSLPDDAKGHLMLIWLLVSQQKEQRIPADARWVAGQIGATSKVNLQLLLEKGFLISIEPPPGHPDNSSRETLEKDAGASRASLEAFSLSLSLSDPDPDQEGESEGKPGTATEPSVPTHGPVDLAELWNQAAPALRPARIPLGREVERHAKRRLQERPLEDWRAIFERANASPFLRGEASDFRATFGWAMERAYFADRVLEGRYDGSPRRVAAQVVGPGMANLVRWHRKLSGGDKL